MQPHTGLLRVVDNLKTEEHGGGETVQRAAGHVTGHGEGSMAEHFGAGVGSERNEIVGRIDSNFEARRVFGRFAVREARVRPVHGKTNV
jgi:hypothetical protein